MDKILFIVKELIVKEIKITWKCLLGHVLSLYNWGSAMFVSGSQDRTVRFWDLRTRGCVNAITPATSPGSRVIIDFVCALYFIIIIPYITYGSK